MHGKKIICVYISDYGYGHATRQVGLIRELLLRDKKKHLTILIKASHTYQFLKDSFSDEHQVQVFNQANSCGVILDKKLQVDLVKTKQLVHDLLKSFSSRVLEEKLFLEQNGVNIVVSDIVAEAIAAAKECEIKSIAVTNFTWYDIYHALYPDMEQLDVLKQAYSSADLLIELGFNTALDYFENKISHPYLARKPRVSKTMMKKKLGISHQDFIVYLSLGKADAGVAIPAQFFLSKKIKFLVSSNIVSQGSNIIQIPAGETESQNYLQLADVVIGKFGYSTFAEALLNGIPILFFNREGFLEDEVAEKLLLKLGVGAKSNYQYLFTHNISYLARFKHIEEMRKKVVSSEIDYSNRVIAQEIMHRLV